MKLSKAYGKTLCSTSISKSAVSSLCKELDKEVKTFRNRALTEYYPFVTVDATYFKVRETKSGIFWTRQRRNTNRVCRPSYKRCSTVLPWRRSEPDGMPSLQTTAM
ncbi:MAG: transposase [Succiniclasticum sp.]|nr:transposase [Succiniclasticum sp.]